MRAGKKHHSITLEADAQHLMTDVWTSIGVIVGVAAVALTGWERLDPIIALLVAANIVWSGFQLLRRSALGLIDTGLLPEDMDKIEGVLNQYRIKDIKFHALRTRQAGMRRFVSVHVLVPGAWTVLDGHHLAEEIENDLRGALGGAIIFTHIEPLEDPSSWDDTQLDRAAV
jgi:cation diffusion facilitator family transporter